MYSEQKDFGVVCIFRYFTGFGGPLYYPAIAVLTSPDLMDCTKKSVLPATQQYFLDFLREFQEFRTLHR